MTETQSKLRRLATALDRSNLDGVLFWTRANFAWLTGGRDNHVGRANPVGVAGLLARRDGSVVCLCSTIESPRYRTEELAGLGIEVIDYPWHEPETARKTISDVIGAARIAADADPLGLNLPGVPAEVTALRQTFCLEEIARYRQCGQIAARAMEDCAAQLKPGMSERDIAGLLDHSARRLGGHALTILIAADERMWKYRHPIPTDARFTKHVMLVLGCEHGGLISSLTRFVSASPISSDLLRRHNAVAKIDATATLATRAGRSLADVFADVQRAYSDVGFADEWKHHHQGGQTGYAPREQLAMPGVAKLAEPNTAYAWNPSVPGGKSEETMLLLDDDARETVTLREGGTFPVETIDVGGQVVKRTGFLEV
jgi:Xaa-Pro aminopeptidase